MGLNHTVSGNIAHFRTPSRVPLESLTFHFLPKQEGSGDPSPSNVRPITGWTGLNGRRAHKNIIKPRYIAQETKNGLTITPTLNGIKVKGTASARTACFLAGTDILSLDLGKKYTFSLYLNGDISECENPFLGYYTSPYVFGAAIGYLNTTNEYVKQWTVPSGYANASAPHIDAYIYVPSGITVDFEIGLQMEAGENATTYEPYSEEQIPITFPDGQTIYGGYIDLVYGELVVEWREQSLKDLNWANYSGNTLFYASIPTYSKDLYSEIYSDHFPVVVNSNPRDNETVGCYKNGAVYAKYIFFYKTGVGNPAGFINWINHLEYDPKIVYKLETPIHILIPESDIKSFLDHNNFWSDANDITEVTYAVVESKDMFDARKRIMSKTWNMLPLLYTEVKYISAKDSNPYIDMGIKFTGELEAEVHYYNDKNEAFLFGARKGASSTPYCNFNIESASSDRSRFDYGNQKAVANSGLPFAGYHDGEYIFSFHNRTATMEKVSTGEVVTKDYSSFVRTDYSDYNMLLFSVNTNGTPSLNTGTGELRVYSAKFWIGGQLVRNLVPCFRKSDNKPGMYDRVSKTFFTNVGSGEFSLPA